MQIDTRQILSRVRIAAIFAVAAFPLAASTGTGLQGVGNFEKVNDHVYRGAQPTEQGFQNLAKLGVLTVIDLQETGSSRAVAEEKWVKAAGMNYIGVPMEGMQTPSDQSIAKVLAVLEDTTTGPVFVHCHRGADRTGGVIACYRIEHDHWSGEKAVAEARSMGMSWYQLAIQNYVRNYRPATATVVEASASAPPAALPN
jgi:tyrosine-protein phosphatase SIW14